MAAARAFRALVVAVSVALVAAASVVMLAPAAHAAPANQIMGEVQDAGSGVTLGGLTVLLDDGVNPPLTTSTDPGGVYVFSPPADLTQYVVIVIGGPDHLSDFAVVDFDDSDPSTWYVPFQLDPGVTITGVVKDAKTGAPLDDVLVFAEGDHYAGPYFDLRGPTSGGTGVFSIQVPPGDDYVLTAGDVNSDYDIQFYDHVPALGGCGCLDADVVRVPTSWPGTPITGIDFDLMAYDDWVYFSVLTLDASGSSVRPGVRVMLDRRTGGGTWVQIDSATSGTGGYADLFADGAGVYRLRTTIGGKPGIIVTFDDFGAGASLASGGRSLVFPSLSPSCGCGAFEEVDVDLALKGASGGGGTPAPRPPQTTSAGPVLPAPATAATPTATPTPSPDPESTPTASPDPVTPTVSPTPAPVPTAAFDAWLWWLLIALLVLGILATVIIIIRRR